MSQLRERVRWGIIGCGNVTEVKSGPGFQKAANSALIAVMRRDREKAADYAARHGIPRFYDRAEDLIGDPDVDAVYVATPPSSHCELGLAVAEARKPCLIEKPMAMNHGECLKLIDAFRRAEAPLFVAYYRRALPRFLKVRELLQAGAIGRLTSVYVLQYDRLAVAEAVTAWRFDPSIAGSGLFMDLASHGIDLVDFLAGRIVRAAGFSVNTGGRYEAEDVTAACFELESGAVGNGIWNFNADRWDDAIILTGSTGEIRTPVFTDGDILLKSGGEETVIEVRNPPHVHQPLIQTVVDDLLGRAKCESTGETGARASWVMDECLRTYYRAD